MLTRLQIEGFKNIRDADVRFGPFTCIAGANGIGKSNLFDAIHFLGRLADESFLDAVAAVRGDSLRAADGRRDLQGGSDVRSLFFRHGDYVRDRMSFEAEIIVPAEGEDHLGQPAKASCTFLRYRLELGLDQSIPSEGARMTLLSESLEPIRKGDAPSLLPFAPKKKAWRDSIVYNDRGGVPFISTKVEEGDRTVIQLHQDGGSRGRPNTLLADRLPRTVLSNASSSESPTALLARRELRSWKLLQLEPAAMRRPDDVNADGEVGTDGSHLPKALHVLARHSNDGQSVGSGRVLAEIGNRLGSLVDDVRAVKIDVDRKRELLTLLVSGRDKVFHPARALSDGTLRFLALAIIEQGRSTDVLCLEEPENGIHPSRIGAMLRLLEAIAVDTDFGVSDDNPLRQMIINTHSPGVVQNVSPGSLLFAESYEFFDRDLQERQKATRFVAIPETWRTAADPDMPTKLLTDIVRYLNFASEVETGEPTERSVKEMLERQLDFGFLEAEDEAVAAD